MMFVPQPEKAANEMRRVTRPGGTVSACTWDRDGLELASIFWEEAVSLDPGADTRSQRPKHSNQEGQLTALWRSAGLEDVKETVLTMQLPFTSFNDSGIRISKAWRRRAPMSPLFPRSVAKLCGKACASASWVIDPTALRFASEGPGRAGHGVSSAMETPNTGCCPTPRGQRFVRRGKTGTPRRRSWVPAQDFEWTR
jgi:hypothetical protein